METWHSQHEDVYCSAGATRARGLRPGNRAAMWCKAATQSGRRKMVAYQIHPQEDAARCAEAVFQGKAGSVGERGECGERTQLERAVKKNCSKLIICAPDLRMMCYLLTKKLLPRSWLLCSDIYWHAFIYNFFFFY